MALEVGRRLGAYEITGAIGAGGMGEVYEARDTRLERNVAIKILPDEFSNDAERVARFEREAKLLAALNHPNVATLHGLEDSDGRRFLVMELVAGETLAERIATGPIPIVEARPLFLQIAEGLEAAHEKGIIHRDLKPANIKIAPDGTVKILDFGLAKAFSPENDVAAEASQSPTLTRGTALGTIMGTASYMSPEQARGKAIDKRTDIWAFGCCLYEALTAKNAFDGDTVSDIISNVLRAEPSWDKVSGELGGLARRCLVKEPRERIRDIGDVRIELSRNESVVTAPARGSRTVLVGGALVAATLGVIVGTRLASTPEAAPEAPVRFTIDKPLAGLRSEGQETYLALTRDGRRLAYVADTAGERQLFLRDMDQAEASPIAGTAGALGPFFSPDGQWLGYFRDEALWKIALDGGAPTRLADAPQSRGASWGEDGQIVFAPHPDGAIWRVGAEGGDVEPLTQLDPTRGERTHRWPEFLPGSRAVLFTIGDDRIATFDEAKIAVHSFETGESRVLIEQGTYPRYAPSGHILYGRGGALLAAPFDIRSLELVGAPVNGIDDVASVGVYGAAHFALSATGTLAYLRGGAIIQRRRLTWVDRDGSEEPVPFESAPLYGVEISPDGHLVALDINAANASIWIHEFDRGTTTRLTFQGSNVRPVWSPDGARIAFSSSRAPYLLRQDINRNWAPEPVGSGIYVRYPYSMSPDGQSLAFTEFHPETQQDVSIVSFDSDEETPFASEAFNEYLPEFSPNGEWIAYVSDENGREEVFIQPYPGPGRKRQVSTDGGRAPLWSPNGQEIFYRAERAVMAVSFATQPDLRIGKPKELFEDRFYRLPAFPQGVTYDIAPDGRFLMIEEDDPPAPVPVEIILNWTAQLNRLAPR